MNRLTPYSGKFAGRRIDSGKLSVDLEYKIKQRQLAGENKFVINKLKLGEKIKSADATVSSDANMSLSETYSGQIANAIAIGIHSHGKSGVPLQTTHLYSQFHIDASPFIFGRQEIFVSQAALFNSSTCHVRYVVQPKWVRTADSQRRLPCR